jgi:hypothetical protein
VKGAPESEWAKTPTTVVEKAPILRDKPVLYWTEQGTFAIFVPELQKETSGVTWNSGIESGKSISSQDCYIAKAKTDNAQSINQALREGKHLILTPGIYELDEPIQINNANTVVLGLGLPTLIPTKGNAVLQTADEPGIVVAGIMADAGLQHSELLIQIGPIGSNSRNPENPISLHDIYVRIGGALPGTAKTTLEINSHNVIGDHFWLWRADHGKGAKWEINRSEYGLIVNGDDVTIYGLFNEHFQHYQTWWKGERGRTYFYQCEIPYEPPTNEVWNDNGKAGFAAYKVADEVSEHQAYGLGIYSFFRGELALKNKVRLENAMEVPDKPGIYIEHITTFSGRVGGINHVINGIGPSTENNKVAFFDGWNYK